MPMYHLMYYIIAFPELCYQLSGTYNQMSPKCSFEAACFQNCSSYMIILALLNNFAIHRDYVILNFCSSICHRCCSSSCCHHTLVVQKLSPLTFTNQLASNFIWGILVCVSAELMDIRIFGLLLQTYQTLEQPRFPYLLTW